MGALEQFGDYEIVRRLGAGGMAEAFLAVRRGPGGFEQRVCLKRVLPAFESDPQFVDLFMKEAATSASLRHGNIVGVIELGEHEGKHFMALELIDGVDLRAILRKHPDHRLTPALTALIASDLAEALDYAHNKRRSGHHRGIIHRDISPSNVLASYAGEVLLTDFGIAKAMKSAVATATDSVKGKVPYMSPEQALGKPMDGRSDLFSLGVMLWEVLTGTRPFDGNTQFDTLKRITEGRRGKLAELAPNAPAPLVETIEDLLHVKREDRIETAGMLLERLTPVAPPPATRRTLGQLAHRTRPPWTLAPDEERVSQPSSAPEHTHTHAAFAETAEVTDDDPDIDRSAATRTRDSGDVEALPAAGGTHSYPSTRQSDPLEAEQPVAAFPKTAPLPDGMVAAQAAATPGPAVSPAQTPARKLPMWALAIPALMLFGVAASVGAFFVLKGLLPGPIDEREEGHGDGVVDASAREVPPPPENEQTEPDAGQIEVAAVEPDPPAEPTAEPDAGASQEASEDAEEPARLTIFAVPWGDIYIDGQRVGETRVTRRVSPGRHTVAVGAGSPTVRRTVTLQPGQRRTITLQR